MERCRAVMGSSSSDRSTSSNGISRVHQILHTSYQLGEQVSSRPISLCVRNIWDIKNHQSQKFDICIVFICYDECGQLFEFRLARDITATDQVHLAEGEIFEFSWYSVQYNSRPRKLTRLPYYIRIDQSSKISKVTDISPTLTDRSFSLEDYKTLLRSASISTHLSDVVGQIRLIQNRNPYRPEISVDVTIGLLLNRSTMVKLILWDNIATDFRILQRHKNRKSEVAIFTSLIPKLYEGKLLLNSSSATAIYFDKSIMPIKHFKGRVKDQGRA